MYNKIQTSLNPLCIGKQRLPYKAELEYIESTGTQYINTGFYADVGHSLEMSCSNSAAGMGVRNFPFGWDANVNGYYEKPADNYWRNTTITATQDTFFTISYNSINKKPLVDGVMSNYNIVFTAKVINLFRLSAGLVFKGRIEYCKIKTLSDDKLAVDLIPVIDYNSVVCMYDKVSKTFFYNQGTGVFIAGPAKKGTPYKAELEWISYNDSINSSVCLITLGSFYDYDEIDYTFKTTSYSAQDVFLGRNNSTGWIGFGGGQTITTGDGFTYVTFTPSLTSSQKGDGVKRTINMKFTAYNGLTNMSIGGYSIESFCRSKDIYSIVGYKNGSIVSNFIPVIDFNNNICMYDRVSKTFFYNQGTGNFIAGPVKKGEMYKAELGYIKSTGTQYINTGYILSSDEVKYGIKYTTPQTAVALTSLYGSETTATPKYTGIWYSTLPSIALFIGSSSNLFESSYSTGTTYDLTTEITGTTVTRILDGVSSTVSYTGGLQKTLPIYLFANNINGTASQCSNNTSIHNFSITEYGEKQIDFIPVIDWNGVVCMYDKVSKTFFYNAGTGVFGYANLNLLDESIFLSKGGAIDSEGYYFTSVSSFAVSLTNNYIMFAGKPNTQYSISGLVKCETATNLGLAFIYLDGTNSGTNRQTVTHKFLSVSATSTAGKTVVGIGSLYNTDGGAWFKNVKVEEGTVVTPYTPYKGE